uniref:Oxysterol-binding protein n=1 Tax=Fundulus heteroclitus TaxID=8078 RepID=A0A3Q2QFS5_FUNHE
RAGGKSWQYDHMENIDGYLMKYTNLVTGWQYMMSQAQGQHKDLIQSIEGLPAAPGLSPLDQDLLMLKATSMATMSCLNECLHILHLQQVARQRASLGPTIEWLEPKVPDILKNGSSSLSDFTAGEAPLEGSRLEFFVLNNEAGLLEYFVNEQSRPQKPRGMLPLAGAVISPSDEDSHTFTVNAISGEQYKLRSDAKERQHWVSRLQICTQHHTEAMGKSNPAPDSRSYSVASQSSASSPMSLRRPSQNAPALFGWAQANKASSIYSSKKSLLPDHLLDAREEQEEVDPEDEVEDSFTDKEEDLGVVEEERSVILHLLSQLKLGMDLTRVVLPTFILEKRSLLEMYADFMSHPELFVAITDGSSPEDRMVRFVEYYLTSFHEGRKGAIAKKPYNPIIGETFHCSWRVPRRPEAPTEPSQGSPEPSADAQEPYQVRFVAEQVSHHPPVSGFYAECQERQMCVNTHVWTKSKFMGMSIGVSMIGECLHLLEHDEEYTFTLPCAYARSILTVPWVELGGKVNIGCNKSGYSAVITFQTKPFYGGKLHVTAEVKHNPSNAVVCRVQGEWNGVLEFSYTSGETKVVDVTKLAVSRKRVRPIEKQAPTESRLWQHVTEALRQKDIEKATEHKRVLEERQRTEERHRAETETPWRTRYFDREGEGWAYRK